MIENALYSRLWNLILSDTVLEVAERRQSLIDEGRSVTPS